MSKKSLSPNSITLMSYLMANETIANKVKASGEQGKTYVIFTVREDGVVVLGETSYPLWNQLIGCRFKLPFESWALAVWDALIDLSTGSNSVALEEGLSKEIAKKAQRSEEYDWVVERLVDGYRHICNNKGNNVSSAGDRGKSGLNERPYTVVNGEPITININAAGNKRTFSFPDATGKAFLDFELGVVGVSAHKG